MGIGEQFELEKTGRILPEGKQMTKIDENTKKTLNTLYTVCTLLKEHECQKSKLEGFPFPICLICQAYDQSFKLMAEIEAREGIQITDDGIKEIKGIEVAGGGNGTQGVC